MTVERLNHKRAAIARGVSMVARRQAGRFAPVGRVPPGAVLSFSFSHDFVSINRIPLSVRSSAGLNNLTRSRPATRETASRNVVFGGHPNRLSGKPRNFRGGGGFLPSPSEWQESPTVHALRGQDHVPPRRAKRGEPREKPTRLGAKKSRYRGTLPLTMSGLRF